MKSGLNPNTIIRMIDDELFIYDHERSVIHTFNETGAFIVRHLHEGMTKDAIIDTLCREFHIDVATASEHYDTFLERLKKQGLLEVTT
jgi:PqqD family protein of HPr-rel-A system